MSRDRLRFWQARSRQNMSNPIVAGRDQTVAGGAEAAPSVRGALAGLSLSMLLSSLSTSIANVALPTLAQAFSASFQEVQWVVLAYLLAITTLIVSVGRLGDIIGRRRLLLAGDRPVHGGLDPVRPRARALAADCRPGGAGPRSGGHDGAHAWRSSARRYPRTRPAAPWGCSERCPRSAPRSARRSAAF